MPQREATSTAPSRTRYGAMHPEWVENELWEQSIRQQWSGYALRQHLGVEFDSSRRDYSQSAYRDTVPGPFWSWERFGRTSTFLPDGRVIHIAGEHEDAYDPDFCIYNDVVVEYAGGRREFYLYPKDVFPPTDFHSATLVGHEIVLIGSLGYRDLRRVGETRVLKLDTRTLKIQLVTTTGEGPGWISRHTAEKLSETAILVIGGSVQTERGYEPNTGVFELDLTTMTWRRRQHGDMALFPIAQEVYRESKSPRDGTSNPVHSDNPFWREMVRRRWPPSRARLHFGDVAPPRPEWTPDGRNKLERTIDDVVWSAVREHAVQLTLADGRKLLVGGEIPDYGDEYADPWPYNDVIVTHPDGAIEILIYPPEAFPHLSWLSADAVVVERENIYIFGVMDRERYPDRASERVVLQLNTSTYEIVPVPAPEPSVTVQVYRGAGVRDGDRVMFPVMRHHSTDSERCIAFDLATLAWGEPFQLPGDD